MKISRYLIAGSVALILLTGCKSKREKLGDEHLANGKYRNAVKMYMAAEKKGDVSEEFYGNTSKALTGLMMQIANRDITSDALNNYFEQIPQYLLKTKESSVHNEYSLALLDITKKLLTDGEFVHILNGFKALALADSVMTVQQINKAAFESSFQGLKDAYVTQTIGKASEEDDKVRAEYHLLEAEATIGDHEKLKEALNAVRIKNRGNFLIFAPDVNGITPNPLVDKYSFVMAMPSVKVRAKKTSGELQIWNTSGNNTGFKAEEILLYSSEGESVKGNRVKGNCDKLENENQCAIWISFKYKKDFTPDYIEVNRDGYIGRKYLGSK